MNLPVGVCLCRKVQVPGSGDGASAWPYRGRVNGGGSSSSLNGSLSFLTLMKSTSLRTPGKVPAVAVIPAPIAYIKVVAVKKLVVELRNRSIGPSSGLCTDRSVLLREDRVCP